MRWRFTVLRQASLFDVHSGLPSWPPPQPRLLRPPSTDAPVRIHSPFFAIIPPPEDAERLHAHGRRVEETLGLRGRALERERLHVTLHRVGDDVDAPDDAEIARWCRAGAAVRCAPFEVVFDRVATFGDDGRPLVFTSAQGTALMALHQSLGMALADTGEPLRRKRIAPHMTLSYGAKRLAETEVEPVRWQAGELVLIDSRVGEHVHEVLGRWTLRG